MNALGLSAEQLAGRRTRLHAGDATAIMAGDYRKVFRRIKGLDADDDLSGEFRVQLGSFTEPFNLAWTVRMTGRPIWYYSANLLMMKVWQALVGDARFFPEELVVCQRYPFMAANLDGMTTTPQGHRCVIDAKHVGAAGEQAVIRYTPAGTWQATCAGTDWWALSFIVGNKWVEPVYEEVDPMYQAEMIARATECWGYIERDEEPPDGTRCDVCGGVGKTKHTIYTFDGDSDRQIPDREEVGPCEECDGTGWVGPGRPVLPPKPRPQRRTIDVPLSPDDPVFAALMQRENWLSEMVEAMGAFATTHAAAARHAIARKDMDRLMPDDVGLVTRGRIKAKRDGRGFVATLEKEPTDADAGR